MENSKIGWTKHTGNLWIGCTHAQSIGCDNCYAEVSDHRWGNNNWGNDVPRRAVKKVWGDFWKWQKEAEALGEVHRVFVGSMMDIFEKPMPLEEPITLIERGKTATFGTGPFTGTGQLRQYFLEVVVERCPNLMFLLLTKRPSNINKYIPDRWKTNPPANVMFGTSPVNQETADRLIPQLLQVRGQRFLSCEPLLGDIDLSKYLWVPKGQLATDERTGEAVINYYYHECGSGGKYLKSPCDNMCAFKPIHWVIGGAESGASARPMHISWIRNIRDKCEAVRVPFFFKQWGEWLPWEGLTPEMEPKHPYFVDVNGKFIENKEDATGAQEFYRIGKGKSGNLLDGKIYENFPEAIKTTTVWN